MSLNGQNLPLPVAAKIARQRPFAIAQQPLTAGAVGGRDAHRAVDGKATAMFPLRHRPRVIGRQQPAAHEDNWCVRTKSPALNGRLRPAVDAAAP